MQKDHKIQKLTLIMDWPHKRTKTDYRALYRCECGNYTVVLKASYKRMATCSCGCLQREMGIFDTIHGMSDSPEYVAWDNMIRRCRSDDPECKPYYKDKGITVCDEWKGKGGFEKFYAHIGPKPFPTAEVDRYPDGDKGYDYGNVRWATRKQQMNNLLNTRRLVWNGVTHAVGEWAEITGLSSNQITARLDYGWSIEDALTKPIREKQSVFHNGVNKTISELADELGITYSALKHRLDRGWDLEKILNYFTNGNKNDQRNP